MNTKNVLGIVGIVVVAYLGWSALGGDGNRNLGVTGPGGFGLTASSTRLDPSGNPKSSNSKISTWTCYNKGKSVGDAQIWWSHQKEDAEWACNNWISTCGNEGGCQVSKISE
ncbi:hypothetical protein ACKFKF_13860 [Phormidesmis sp. 146-12]